MGTVALVFPHQLFREWINVRCDYYALIEDSLFFGDKQYPVRFHKHKLILHRATMKAFEKTVLQGRRSIYYQFVDFPQLRMVVDDLNRRGFKRFIVFEPVDYVLERRLRGLLGSQLTVMKSPNFLTDQEEFSRFFEGSKRRFLHQFYIWQRKRLDILLVNGKPYGGRWSFDDQNRKRLPKNIKIPEDPKITSNSFTREAVEYVDQHFGNNPGFSKDFNFPVTHREAEDWLQDFVENKLTSFGPYQDAISKRGVFLFHSGLSCLINIGLLSPANVIDQALQMIGEVKLESLEGFVRQIIGWREFMRAVYVLDGSRIRKSNLFNHHLKLNDSSSFGIQPVDDCLNKAVRHCYLHHIERLMVLGNFFLLCGLHPDEVYRWFMAYTIDAYDWVMVPNVYAMSQFACGDFITTKPYFSGSNYLLRMSDYSKGSWCNVWDGLFYRFISKNREILLNNGRMGPIVSKLLSLQGVEEKIKVGEEYVRNLRDQGVLFE